MKIKDEINENDKEVLEFLKQSEMPSVKTFMIARQHKKIQVHSGLARNETVINKLDFAELNSEEHEIAQELVENFSDVFKLENEKLSSTVTIVHNVPLDTDAPIYTKPYRLMKAEAEAAERQVREWLDEGIIRPSVSPYNSPLVVVKKKGHTEEKPNWRICVDLRNINKHVQKSFFQIPSIHAIIQEVKKGSWFSTLDLASGYLQVELMEEDRQKISFTLNSKRYEFNRMPFGLISSSFCFAKMMSIVLDGMLDNVSVICYLDDVLVITETFEEMTSKLKEIFLRFRQHNLVLNPDKVNLFKKQVSFVGYIFSENGVTASFDKAILKCREPSSKSEIMSFIAMTNFFKVLIPRHAELSEPLLALIRKKNKIQLVKRMPKKLR